MTENTNISAATAQVTTTVTAQATTNKVRCITELRPWATVLDGDRKELRPLEIDEVVTVPANEGPILQKNRHAIIIG